VSVTFHPKFKKRKLDSEDQPGRDARKENIPAAHTSKGTKARKMDELRHRQQTIEAQLHRLRVEAERRSQLSISVNAAGEAKPLCNGKCRF
jgi:DNA repair exonuclease SbcCD ATPase subunit